ncbi:hypothetical protein A3D81_01365 [Candidatus Curtissbacteria bacterium RIFCSPHIGHO2_02_FULL_40_17]|uniref:Glycosyl transferase family 1 domain-containing protein n=4 Tax=Candidatus Curtissiibacteriota TaxID=1752717 RepID=A0A1F5GHU6_9BACT|nr:MAG: hypothetical protein A2693_02380 [Candidatus Curtissbacteria bacterium RIFCSPHIGHO2_01_FULL_40_12]OGD91430.1 MAG: hypothetical protein A3D81_01365 [Candidatus Curtissbacteria bacterium RIFCSPHIGHO2_02_FULL_40_17]OGE03339.1 MAG: hypothetical protein A3F45_03325 [Candidatus Curtissbacteria bacterium RIFCSPHIGHO2_12_FULL_41_17]OGE06073.1 MAG: hypothetical protein A3I53_01265 [Candidatus Curtissbacteria bacterium RIFCSPLOWO2_02_FULL_40_13b]
MKIAIDISQIVYGTGVSNYTRELIEAIAKLDRKNEYVLFGSSLRQNKILRDFKNSLSDYSNFQIKLFHFPLSILEFLWNRLHIYSLEKFIGEVDLYHSSNWLQAPVKSKQTVKVTTVHDMVSFLFPSSVHRRILANEKRRFRHIKKEVDIVIADSQSTKEDLVKFLEIPQEKIRVIYLAPSSKFSPKDDDKVKETLEKYKIKKPYILSVATQEPRKNIQKLLDVFSEIGKLRTGVSLVLCGNYGWGPGLHYEENVIFTDYVSEEDLISLYSGCRVFVYPSLYEGFGLPILEAMACGAPVITSNNSSMSEIAKDTAILIDPRSEGQLKRAIELVLDLNLDNYQKMVRASLDRARHYSWTKTAKETLKVYEEVAGENADRPGRE